MGVFEWVILALVVIGAIAAMLGWDRYRGHRKTGGPAGTSQPTGEMFIDPVTGQRMRVWYDSATGQREYRPE